MNSCELNELSNTACNAISWGLYLCYALLGGSILAAVGLTIYNALKDTKGLVYSAGAIGVLVVLFGVSYVMSDGVLSASAKAMGVDESSSRMIGAGLIMFYIMLLVSILGLVVSEVRKLFM